MDAWAMTEAKAAAAAWTVMLPMPTQHHGVMLMPAPRTSPPRAA
jgi:hypothetical protein